MDAIIVDQLAKRYGQTLAVDSLSFTASEGRLTAFLGPNGAGKTTTLGALVGLTRPTSGSATFAGRQYRDLDHPVRTVGAMLEANSFHPGRKGRDHLRVMARAGGLPLSRVDEVLGLVGLTEAANRRVNGYSLGMRQRLGLGAALLGDPEILVLDEPANGLDPEGIRWLRTFLRDLVAQGRTVLVSSHVLAEVAQAADDVVVIAQGRLVAQAPLQELARTTGALAAVRIRTPNAGAAAATLEREGLDVTDAGDGALLIQGAEPEEIGRAISRAGLTVYEIQQMTPTLEDMFFALTEREKVSGQS